MNRKSDPVEIVAIAVPILAEAIAVILFIAMIAAWSVIVSGG